MNFIHSIILGIVEGLTEFLPVSSTAHLDLVRTLMELPASDFIKSFEVIIQLGAILAVAVLFWSRIRDNFRLAVGKLSLAFLPTAVIGLAMYKIIKTYFLGNTILIISTLFIGGLAIILFEKFHQTPVDDQRPALDSISWRQAFLIGCAQSVAMVPGISRSAATIIGGLSMGISRRAIAEFSFLLAIPTMAAATGLDLLKSGWSFSAGEYTLLAVGFASAFVTALLVIRWFMSFIQQHSFAVFGWYRLFIGTLLAWWFWFR